MGARYPAVAALASITAVALIGCGSPAPLDYSGPTAEWPHWGGSEEGVRFSPLTQITPDNVDRLQVAWKYSVGELPPADEGRISSWNFVATPIVADGRMYLCTPLSRVIALDPESGQELWIYDPELDGAQVHANNCRGVTFYRDSTAAHGAACATRILTGTLDARLIALDAGTGEPCADFGTGGTVDLLETLGDVRPEEYNSTAPPVVVADRILVPVRAAGLGRMSTPSGVIRAYDVRTGELAWAWNALPPGVSDEELAPPGEIYARGTANAWAPYSVDEERGLVFIPVGSPQPDYFAAATAVDLRHYAASVVALDAGTGRLVWHFQLVHRDLWDYDAPAQPVLIDFPTDQGPVPAVVQSSKAGNIFVLHRETGEPLVPVEERPVPQSGGVPEEAPAPTQPFPSNSAYTLYPGDIGKEDMWGFTPWDRAKCREKLDGVLNEGLFTPPSVQGSMYFPFAGGILNWGGIAVDTSRNILVTNTSRVASILYLVPRDEANERSDQGDPLPYPLEGSPYTYDRELLLSPFGAPCNPPPWGTLVAIDLEAGERLWEVPLGTTRDLAPFPFWFNHGTPTRGGPIVTASGLVFVAATTDRYFRAFDTTTGERLWQDRLPAAGQTVPITYRLRPGGKQYVALSAGAAEGMGIPISDHIVAYAIED